MSIIGTDKSIKPMIFLSEYSSIFFFENIERRNKNIKNASNGSRIKIPVITNDVIELNAKKKRPIKSHIKRNEYLQFSFSKNLLKSSNAIILKSKSDYLNIFVKSYASFTEHKRKLFKNYRVICILFIKI
ncbi:MAG: hypothetical protein BAJALOKI2v1_20008 [Promethearchaeota archaeon]|nr:MAG: hypothetical protein BAJALOKI2v1_20008 [Candidatus Lokiarchaeota archaeon]